MRGAFESFMLAIEKAAQWLASYGVFVGRFYDADRPARRKLRDAAITKIADARDGELVKIVGRLEPHATVIAPLSGRECSYFEAVIDGGDERARIHSTEARE